MGQDDNRVTKACLTELSILDRKSKSRNTQLNWVSKLRYITEQLEISLVQSEDCKPCWNKYNIWDLTEQMRIHTTNSDLARAEKSSYSSFYRRMKGSNNTENYLNYELSLHHKHLFCTRLHPDITTFLSIYANSCPNKFQPTHRCPLCGKGNDDFYHALSMCPHFNSLTRCNVIAVSSPLDTHKMFRDYGIIYIQKLCNFTRNFLLKRNFILDE